MIIYFLVGAIAASLGFLAGSALSASKVSDLYRQLDVQRIMIADLTEAIQTIAAVLEDRRDNSGRELVDMTNDLLTRHKTGNGS